MSARWVARILGVLMLVVFLMLMANLQKRLMEIQNRQPVRTTTTATTGTP
jgi:hypothetical protein